MPRDIVHLSNRVKYQFPINCQFNGEALSAIYESSFGFKTNGRFVEIGASNGYDYSNTWGLSEIGWAGIYVEPVPSLAEACRIRHAKNLGVKTICAAAGSSDGRGKLWMIPSWGTATSNQPAAVEVCGKPEEIECEIVTVDSLLIQEMCPSVYDLLVIDVDFGETEVLKGMTLSKFTPKLVIIELHELSDHHPMSIPIQEFSDQYFSNGGYEKIYKDAINTLYRLK